MNLKHGCVVRASESTSNYLISSSFKSDCDTRIGIARISY
jgi:hypothetical protein